MVAYCEEIRNENGVEMARELGKVEHVTVGNVSDNFVKNFDWEMFHGCSWC